MRLGRLAFVCATAVAVAGLLPSAHVGAATLPVSGTGTTGGSTPVTFTGNLDITRFVAWSGQLLAVGTLTGTVTDAAGTVLGAVNQSVQLPVLFGPNARAGLARTSTSSLAPFTSTSWA